MKIDTLQELAKYQQKVAALEKELGKLNRRLLALPAKFGFKSVDELIAALRTAAKGGAKAARGKAGRTGGRRKRAVITAEMKQKVKTLSEGGKTGAEIARAVGISLPSVQNIKNELGLVKKRK